MEEERRPVLARLRRVLGRLTEEDLELAKSLEGRRLHRWNNRGEMQPMILEVLHESAHPSRKAEHPRNREYYDALLACSAQGLGLTVDELDNMTHMIDEVEFRMRPRAAAHAVRHLIQQEREFRKSRRYKTRKGQRRKTRVA